MTDPNTAAPATPATRNPIPEVPGATSKVYVGKAEKTPEPPPPASAAAEPATTKRLIKLYTGEGTYVGKIEVEGDLDAYTHEGKTYARRSGTTDLYDLSAPVAPPIAGAEPPKSRRG